MSLPEFGGLDTGINYYNRAQPGEYDLLVSNSEGGRHSLFLLCARHAGPLLLSAGVRCFGGRGAAGACCAERFCTVTVGFGAGGGTGAREPTPARSSRSDSLSQPSQRFKCFSIGDRFPLCQIGGTRGAAFWKKP